MSKSLATATPRIVARVIAVLQAKLSTELAAIGAPAQLYLPAPDANAYFSIPEEARLGEPMVHNTAVYVYPSTIRRTIQRRLQGPTEYGSTTEVGIAVVVAFRMAPQDVFQYFNKTITTAEIMQLRAHYYNAGVIETLLKYAINPDDVNDLILEEEQGAVSFLEGRELGGIAFSSWTMTQDTRLPVPQIGAVP